ncbi:hypothetical protein PISL3812_04096 [Talaromyces islandicus]|uniref:Wax synthase domain-containing protein n=1 Tax=Talaromyces islandicus TaxID=28573 RepID=A0A0U1LWP8_TALIS|nr:hypothetical protein PISL3812_04096 [Talaromyces islandicus]
MAEIPFQSHLDLVEIRQEAIDTQLREGSVSPLILKHVFGGICLVLIPLLFRPSNTLQSQLARYAFHTIITGLSIYSVLYVRFIGPGNGYSVGLITTWFFIWSSTLLVFNDVQKDFKRIEKEYVQQSNQPLHDSLQLRENLELKGAKNCSNRSTPVAVPENKAKRKVYHWQSFPDSFPHRVDWILDLVFNFRGPNWNWRARSAPPPPDVVLNDIGDHGNSRQVPASRLVGVQDSSTRLRQAMLSFLRDYIVLDIIKVVMMRDPYFWGFVDNHSPPWPFSTLAFSPILVRIYRLLLSMSAVIFALDIIVALGPLFFMGLSLAFPRFSRSITHQPLDEAWLYPPAFGPASSVLDYGLIGAWSIWWHQLFRFGFSESGRFISHLVIPPISITPDQKQRQQHSFYTLARRLVQVLGAFSMSGLIHAMGSYTAVADTKPFNAFLFFFLQGIAVLVEGLFFSQEQAQTQLQPRRTTLSTRLLNLTLVCLWFYFTGPLIADDLSRSGVWTFEPLPISPLRGLATWSGVEVWGKGQEDGWACWRGLWVEQWDGETWWQSGIRLR